MAIIHPEDLSLRAIEQKIPGRLPTRDLEGMEPLVAALEGLASEYRERTAEERARKGPRGVVPGCGLDTVGIPASICLRDSP